MTEHECWVRKEVEKYLKGCPISKIFHEEIEIAFRAGIEVQRKKTEGNAGYERRRKSDMW